jgi:hypothetical protein
MSSIRNAVLLTYHSAPCVFTFIETVPPAPRKRNPHIFNGRYITITRKDDGGLHPNFKNLKVDEHFSIECFAVGVANELMLALECLIEK